jgi:RHH-type proline utilization regulon transcriptional repressor/proline dehydrogenase/delta 1-pyrroline-5-carboxylate dehydrogenase
MSANTAFNPPSTADVQPPRSAIDAHYRAAENDCVPALLAQLELSSDSLRRIDAYARQLVETVRAQTRNQGGIEAFLHQYGLSTQEGVLLMCIAEALLRVPDDQTRERLIRDKLSGADWQQHLGQSNSWFVNASTWALMLTGTVVRMHGHQGSTPGAAMRRLTARLGEPVVRESVNQAMKIMGRQFVMGRTIEAALNRARAWQDKGYTYSYDMLGEAARTMADAKRYFQNYRDAIALIGQQAAGQGPIKSPGVSVKLSALHPRYEVANATRVIEELLPRAKALCKDAARYDIGFNIDAEEADRLDISLDVLERLSADPELKDWQGLGVVVQTYLKRAPMVLDWLAEIGRRDGRRFMVRLVKGAYWDMEIKRAQEQGLVDYPVFTRKANTDVSYLACARKLFAHTDVFYPQLATHNAHTIAAVLEFAGENRDFEFQRLHGMGEELFAQVIEQDRHGIGCRIYAPVGQHEDLLAYLVRRLLENGANSSFVNRIQDENLPVDEIIADPIATVRAYSTFPHPKIPQPGALYGPQRPNAKGLDLTDRTVLAALQQRMAQAGLGEWTAGPIVNGQQRPGQNATAVVSPQRHSQVIGHSAEASAEDIEAALVAASTAAADWAATPVAERAACLERMADLMEAAMPRLMALCTAEAGKSLPDGVAEVREAVDFCRYYALRAREDMAQPMPLRVAHHGAVAVDLRGGGVFTCISPWNFPLAIFTGQVVAALVAGNAVLAKPAEQTPLIAAEAVRLLHQAGIPPEVLHLLPGEGSRVGGTLVQDPRVSGVCFTGSTEVARLINRTLAERDGVLPPLIAETGGQNAMIVDSTALPEQVTRDVLVSAFQSAGQRCSALRVLCLQEDIADKTLAMIAGAMEELTIGDPASIATDVGPVIDAEAKTTLDQHIQRMLSDAQEIKRAKLGPQTGDGTFVTPAAFEIEDLSQLGREVFGPVLHIVRYRADELDQLVERINATGYGLTLGIHTRIDEMWRQVFERARVGNTYVNRNQIGAIVGVQPFGGQGLSGTGPKAGGPHYLQRFVAEVGGDEAGAEPASAVDFNAPLLSKSALAAAWETLENAGHAWSAPVDQRALALEQVANELEHKENALAENSAVLRHCTDHLRFYAAQIQNEFAVPLALPGPTGERNELSLWPRGPLVCLCLGDVGAGALAVQVGAALAAGNPVLAWHADESLAREVVDLFHQAGVPTDNVLAVGHGVDAPLSALVANEHIAGVACAGPMTAASALNRVLAAGEGMIRPLILYRESSRAPGGLGHPTASSPHYLHRFVHERSLSIDTTASGGNASLLSIEDGPSLPGQN